MGEVFKEISKKDRDFISKQQIFFVGTAPKSGNINVSPKGMDSFRVLDSNHIIWLNMTGSGNETAAHLLEDTRMTIMFCSFEKKPQILRLYGHAREHQHDSENWSQLLGHFPDSTQKKPGIRQIFDMKVDMVQTSCGYQVPMYDYKEERELLDTWAENKGTKGVREYWKGKNQTSLNGKPTGLRTEV